MELPVSWINDKEIGVQKEMRGDILKRPTSVGLRFELAIDFGHARLLKCDFNALFTALLDSEGRIGWQREMRYRGRGK